MEFEGSRHNKENMVKKYQPLLKSYEIELFVNIAYVFDRLSCSVCSVQLGSSAPPLCLQMQLLTTLAFAGGK